MLLYTVLLLAVSVLPFATGMSGGMYFVGALILGAIFLVFVFRLYRHYSDALSKQTFGYSIQYLAMLLMVLPLLTLFPPPFILQCLPTLVMQSSSEQWTTQCYSSTHTSTRTSPRKPLSVQSSLWQPRPT